MKILFYIALVVLVFLAVSSGISKIMLIPQEVEFFSQYGFNDTLLIIFGVIQLLGGQMLILQKTRRLGARIVGFTFVVSALLLVLSGNIVVALITLMFVGLLGFVVKQSARLAK